MSLERENANGPTQVHPALNYNDLTQHLHGLNGINNGINGIIGNSKPFGERGKLSKRFQVFFSPKTVFLTKKEKFRKIFKLSKFFQ